jgi:hypothetical protein
MIARIWATLFLLAIALVGLAWLLQLRIQCTPEDPPGPTIAGVIRIGGCP